MRRKRNIRLVTAIFMAVAIALILPSFSFSGSLEPPTSAVDSSGNPVPTTHPKFACRGAFMNNHDGTVTDCKTGLIWLQNANCFGLKNWNDAKSSCSSLASGSCTVLNDGSSAGDWRLPTIEELKTLPDTAYSNPALSNAKGDGPWTHGDAFWFVQSSPYWSSTLSANCPSCPSVWYVDFNNGYAGTDAAASDSYYVWCIRGGN
jgi:hypothetical protein